MLTNRRLWSIWVGLSLLWTALLVAPIPESVNDPLEDITLGKKFLVAKSVHIAGYALWTILSGWLRLKPPFRLLLLFSILAHAPLTELIQLRVSGRSGSLQDVAFDHLGTALGLALSWKWWKE